MTKLLDNPDSDSLVIPGFKKPQFLGNEAIWDLFLQKEHLMEYIPDKDALKYLPRRFLFSVIYYVDSTLWTELQDSYLKEKERRELGKFEQFTCQVNKELFVQLSSMEAGRLTVAF